MADPGIWTLAGEREALTPPGRPDPDAPEVREPFVAPPARLDLDVWEVREDAV